jgi:ribosomal protein S18 acetylase RimI-like enzyme
MIGSTAITFRYAQPADAEAVLEFWSRAAEDNARPSDDADAVRRLIAHDPRALELAVDVETIVGTLISGFDGWRCALYRLAVEPEKRGQGIARALLERAEQRFIDLRATRATAMVLDENEVGRDFWRARGYVPQADWSRWVASLPRPT